MRAEAANAEVDGGSPRQLSVLRGPSDGHQVKRVLPPSATPIKAVPAADGDVLILARSQPGASDGEILLRVRSDGRLDRRFGRDGTVALGWGHVSDLAVQSDGSILLAGTGGSAEGAFTVMRLLANGTLDRNFGSDGFATPVLPGSISAATAVTIGARDRIFAAGTFQTEPLGRAPDNRTPVVVSFDQDGKLNAAFGLNGVVSLKCCGKPADLFSVRGSGVLVMTERESGITVSRLGQLGHLTPQFGKKGTVKLSDRAPGESFVDLHTVAFATRAAGGFAVVENVVNVVNALGKIKLKLRSRNTARLEN